MSAPAPPAPVAGAQTIDWKGTRVPQPVHYALSAKWRGQKGLDGPKQSAVLSFFVDEPALVKMGQTTMGGGAAPELTPKENVATFLILKADPANPATRFGPYSYGNINPTRLVELFLNRGNYYWSFSLTSIGRAHGGLPRIICPICALAVERIRAGGGKRALWLAQCTRDPCRRALRQSSF